MADSSTLPCSSAQTETTKSTSSEAAGESFADAISAGWTCQQTYIRNHVGMEAALRCLMQRRCSGLRILDIGGGVLEPLLLAGLLRDIVPAALPVAIHAIDPSDDTAALFSAMKGGTRCEGGHGLLFDPSPGQLNLRALAKTFGSPENPLNRHLTDDELLLPPLLELEAMGLLTALGLPPTADAAREMLQRLGWPVPPQAMELITFEQRGILALEAPVGHYDLICAHFSIQYPITEGHANEVAERLERWLAPGGVILHGATYGAQVKLLQALANRGQWEAVFGVRELDTVQYHDDPSAAAKRLRIRTDVILRRPTSDWMYQSIWLTPPPTTHHSANICTLLQMMDAQDGLSRSRMAASLYCDETGAKAWFSDREELLLEPKPLASRIEWRARRREPR